MAGAQSRTASPGLVKGLIIALEMIKALIISSLTNMCSPTGGRRRRDPESLSLYLFRFTSLPWCMWTVCG